MNPELEARIIAEVPKDDSTSYGEKMLLYWLIRELQPETVIETGTHRGLTSLYLAAALADNNKGHLTTCDPNSEWGQVGNFGKFPELNDRITFILGPGKDLEVTNVDFAFIDGFHDFKDVFPEIQMLLPRLSDTATVVFHDCWYGNTDGVNEAVEAFGLNSIWLPTKNALRFFSKQTDKPKGPQDL